MPEGIDTLIARARTQYIEPDEDTWTIHFDPSARLSSKDLKRLANLVGSINGINAADREDETIIFTMDFESLTDPEEALATLNKRLNTVAQEHFIATEIPGNSTTLELRFRRSHTEEELQAFAERALRSQGVFSVEPTDNNSIIVSLSEHFETAYGVRHAMHHIAAALQAHVCDIRRSNPFTLSPGLLPGTPGTKMPPLFESQGYRLLNGQITNPRGLTRFGSKRLRLIPAWGGRRRRPLP